MAKRILLLASGSGSLARAILQAVKDDQLNVEVVELISDRQSHVLDVAKEFGVKSTLVDFSLYDSRMTWGAELANLVRKEGVDLVVSVGFMRILPEAFVNEFPTINTHPALLPLFPGAHAVSDALAAKASITGSTVHWVDAGVDTGKVISQISVEISPEDTEESLHERIKIQERKLIVETLETFAAVGLEK